VKPVLIGKDVLNKLSIVIMDGDSQEINQLKDAVNKFSLNGYSKWYSWHIIDRR
jgi:hypothetical protein